MFIVKRHIPMNRARGDGGIDVKGREIKCEKQPVSSIFGKIG